LFRDYHTDTTTWEDPAAYEESNKEMFGREYARLLGNVAAMEVGVYSE
jgi:hypothetical protein